MAVIAPTTLSASQLYSPSSATVTRSKRKLRSSKTLTRSIFFCFFVFLRKRKTKQTGNSSQTLIIVQNLPKGILPPDAVRNHKTSGIGSPPTRQGKVTDVPSKTI